MAQDQSTKVISTIKWIRTGRLSIKNSLPLAWGLAFEQYNKSNGEVTEEATVSVIVWSHIEPELIFFGKPAPHPV